MAVSTSTRPDGTRLEQCLDVQPVIEQLADDKVRLTVEVSGHDVHHAVEHAAGDLAQSVRIPGFRKGKVPMPLLVQRVGRERLYSEAVESHIGSWFWSAATRARVNPVALPEYEYELPTSDHDNWQFVATVDVQPKPEPADWTELEVPRDEAGGAGAGRAGRARGAPALGRRARPRRGPRRRPPATPSSST